MLRGLQQLSQFLLNTIFEYKKSSLIMRFIHKQHISANKIGVAYDNVCHIVKLFHQPQTSANINLY